MSQATIDRVASWVSEHRLSGEAGRALAQWLSDSDYAGFIRDIEGLVLSEDLDELEDAFRTHIEFGTGGIRGKMGPGPNRINARTIGAAAQGLARYIRRSGGTTLAERGVVIAYDTRANSERFARETAAILAGNGVAAHIFPSCRSTPELSFSVRELEAAAGVVISASHNPPTDNGFKAYWTDGGQVVPPHDQNIIEEVRAVKQIDRADYESAVSKGVIRVLDDRIDRTYHERLACISLSDERDVCIVYTPLHGVGATSIVPALRILGFRDLHLVDEQAVQDGSFPTVAGGVANPEDPRALTLAVRKAAEVDADIAIASDPDADRLGCALPHPETGWTAPPEELVLNGNQIGVVLCHYLLQRKKELGQLPEGGVVAKTIVTSDLTGIVARSFGVEVVDDLLVGFKYIAEVIENLPPEATFLYGTEESHGYLAGSFVRDKDAATAAVLLAECAASLKARGRTVRQYLDDIYREYGYFRELQKSASRTGAAGGREIQQIMQHLREHPPLEIGGHPVVEVIDRLAGEARNPRSGARRDIDGARGNVIAFTFTDAGHTRVTARPSGTEPKIKYYVSAGSTDHPRLVADDLGKTKEAVDGLAKDILDGMVAAAESAIEAEQ